MPMYDRICPNDHQLIDCWEPITAPSVMCPECQLETKRVWLSKPANVIGDDIPGGILISHAICNEDGSPKRYYSKSEIAKAAKAKGYSNHVEHVTDPRSGSDKNPHTTRWI